MLLGGRSFSGHERNVCFLNTGAPRFADVSAVSGLDFDDDARALGVVDWDQDGDLDFWIANRSGPCLRVMRNDIPSGNGYVALRLQGTGGNRDAVGARVTVHAVDGRGQPLPPLVRAVRAGEGYLAQSSKWVHVGLPQGAAITKVAVRWPGAAAAEAIAGIRPNARWTVVQGSGKAEPWIAPARSVNLAASPLHPPRESSSSRGFLAARVPTPDLPYETSDGRRADARLNQGKVRLINLWGSGCRACNAELRDFTKHADRLRAAGVEILALNIEAAREMKGNDLERARRFLRDIAFPFPSGFARSEAVDRLEAVVNQLNGRLRALVLPTSLLLDRAGRIAAVYHGPVEVDILLDDVNHLDDDDAQRMAHSLPFPGRWHRPRLITPIRPLADKLYVDGELDQALRFYEEALAGDPKDPLILLGMGAVLAAQQKTEQAMEMLRRGLSVDPKEPLLHEHLGMLFLIRRDHAQAEQHFLKSRELAPNSAEAHFNLGTLYRDKGEADRAIAAYRKVVELAVDHSEAHMWIGILLSRKKRLDEGLTHLKLAVKFAPDQPETHYYLGASLGVMGRHAEAMEAFQKVLSLNPQYPGAREGIEWLKQEMSKPGR